MVSGDIMLSNEGRIILIDKSIHLFDFGHEPNEPPNIEGIPIGNINDKIKELELDTCQTSGVYTFDITVSFPFDSGPESGSRTYFGDIINYRKFKNPIILLPCQGAKTSFSRFIPASGILLDYGSYYHYYEGSGGRTDSIQITSARLIGVKNYSGGNNSADDGRLRYSPNDNYIWFIGLIEFHVKEEYVRDITFEYVGSSPFVTNRVGKQNDKANSDSILYGLSNIHIDCTIDNKGYFINSETATLAIPGMVYCPTMLFSNHYAPLTSSDFGYIDGRFQFESKSIISAMI